MEVWICDFCDKEIVVVEIRDGHILCIDCAAGYDLIPDSEK